MKCILFLSLLPAAFAQSGGPAAAPSAPAGSGVANEWDARKMLDALSGEIPRFEEALKHVQTETWKRNGAPDTYLAQVQNAGAELRYLKGTIEAFKSAPERLPPGLETYFRMEAMISTFETVLEGVRQYQNPALADLLQAVIPQSNSNRSKLRQYLQDLSKEKETEFQVADLEAQRCREGLMKQAGPPVRRK